jgi:hypothetical protein
LSDATAEWSRCKPWIAAALEHDGGLQTLEAVERAIEAGEAHFWPGKASAIVTQFWDFPTGRALNFWLAGGKLDELMNHMRPAIEAWGAEHGCNRFIIAGRPGWARALKPDGYTALWTALCKDATP